MKSKKQDRVRSKSNHQSARRAEAAQLQGLNFALDFIYGTPAKKQRRAHR